MADIPPSNIPGAPTGAVPPVKKETGKVQPKKETVRINLPPKPSAAPTIKLPTLPPGGPTGAPSSIPLTTAKAQSAPTAAAPKAATAAAPAAAPATNRPAPTAAPRAMTAGAPTIGTLDKILIISAAVAGVFAIVTSIIILVMLSKATTV